MNFDAWFNICQTRARSNPGAGLVAFEKLLARLGNPQRNFKIIHVAGTNGKGSVCMMLSHALSGSGFKTGLFISPHLISPTERIQIDGAEIAPQDFIGAVEKVQSVQCEPLNFFELLTAAALVYFAQKKVQYVILETGLGGRKDPTNVCMPVLSIITSVGLDHTQILGDTLEKIAAEKAGIIKPGIPVLCGNLPPQAARVMEEAAYEKNAPLERVGVENILGNAREQNVQLVRRAAKRLGISDDIIDPAVETAPLPGRFEIFQFGTKTIVLDGAHNPQAVENLLAFWQKTPYVRQSACVLCGFMQDKDYPGMLTQLSGCFKKGMVTVPSAQRGAGEKELRSVLPAAWTFEPEIKKAFTTACLTSDVICCTGSFYLVGAVRAYLIWLRAEKHFHFPSKNS